jgi:hypothetical protein
VVKDALSDSDHRPPLAETLGRESDDERARSPAGNLTQELAQLLAAAAETRSARLVSSALYQKAFDLGVAQAEQRLDALR